MFKANKCGKEKSHWECSHKLLSVAFGPKKMMPTDNLLHRQINSGLFFLEYTDSLVMNNPEFSLNLLLFKSSDQCFYGFGEVR